MVFPVVVKTSEARREVLYVRGSLGTIRQLSLDNVKRRQNQATDAGSECKRSIDSEDDAIHIDGTALALLA